jgi:hypothetical protein
MTGGAAELTGGTEALVVEQLVTQGHFGFTLGIVGRDGHLGQAEWTARDSAANTSPTVITDRRNMLVPPYWLL